MQRVLSLHSVKISSELAGGFMRTCAADCLSTLLTSQMVGWTWARSETATFSLKSLSSVPLTAPRLLLTFCLSYICAVSVASRVLYFCWNDSAQTRPHTHNSLCSILLSCLESLSTNIAAYVAFSVSGFTESSTLSTNMWRVFCLQSNTCTHLKQDI